MTLNLVLISILISLILGLLGNIRWRLQVLLGLSAIAVFAFQPALPVRNLDFWIPTGTLFITVITWILTTPHDLRSWQTNWSTGLILVIIVLMLGMSRYFTFSLPLTASHPPQITQIIILLAGSVGIALLLWRLTKPGNVTLYIGIIILILFYLTLKISSLSLIISKLLRYMNHQSTSMASGQDLRWFGFSYIAFRLLHTIRDRQSGRLPTVSLAEYVVYIIFFPALAAGPIDRIDRFILDLRRPMEITSVDLGHAGRRLAFGLFKKFVIADTLALIALNGTIALQVKTSGWGWFILYAYAFQIFFDFSGYSDIAIGLGSLLGIHLPENFNAPYLKPNLTQFWNNWHMSLTQWFRAYFFNPLTRLLKTGWKKLPASLIIFVTQLTTMILIGLWHGVTLNFVLWGFWHGLGLFIHNRWAEFTKPFIVKLSSKAQKILNVGGVLFTFNYVTLGWVFFALPDPSISMHYFKILLGLA